MKILLKEVGKDAVYTDIDGSLESMQKIVGGYIETVSDYEHHYSTVCNEDGMLLGLPKNIKYKWSTFYGDVFFVGFTGDDFCDLPEETAELIKETMEVL